jgi:hypothetical protein
MGGRHVPTDSPPGKTPGIHCIGGRVGPRAGLDGCRKSRPSGIQSPDFPARRKSLCRLSYPGPPADLVATECIAVRFRSLASISQTPRSGIRSEGRCCIAAVKKKVIKNDGRRERKKETKTEQYKTLPTAAEFKLRLIQLKYLPIVRSRL